MTRKDAEIQPVPLGSIELQLQNMLESEERNHIRTPPDKTDSLWSHSTRVASIAERIGRLEDVDPIACRLAGLFHDAGKFVNGIYHHGKTKEEEHSVIVFREMTRNRGIDEYLIKSVGEAISQIYQTGTKPSLLAKILFDADNLDKLGLQGVSNFFIKAGLRGKGLNYPLLYQISVELTYARYAPKNLMTKTGRMIAEKKAVETINFFKQLLKSLQDDELFDFCVTEVEYDGLLLDLVESPRCKCGAAIEREIWDLAELKCTEIHVLYQCTQCNFNYELHFCRPRAM